MIRSLTRVSWCKNKAFTFLNYGRNICSVTKTKGLSEWQRRVFPIPFSSRAAIRLFNSDLGEEYHDESAPNNTPSPFEVIPTVEETGKSEKAERAQTVLSHFQQFYQNHSVSSRHKKILDIHLNNFSKIPTISLDKESRRLIFSLPPLRAYHLKKLPLNQRIELFRLLLLFRMTTIIPDDEYIYLLQLKEENENEEINKMKGIEQLSYFNHIFECLNKGMKANYYSSMRDHQYEQLVSSMTPYLSDLPHQISNYSDSLDYLSLLMHLKMHRMPVDLTDAFKQIARFQKEISELSLREFNGMIRIFSAILHPTQYENETSVSIDPLISSLVMSFGSDALSRNTKDDTPSEVNHQQPRAKMVWSIINLFGFGKISFKDLSSEQQNQLLVLFERELDSPDDFSVFVLHVLPLIQFQFQLFSENIQEKIVKKIEWYANMQEEEEGGGGNKERILNITKLMTSFLQLGYTFTQWHPDLVTIMKKVLHHTEDSADRLYQKSLEEFLRALIQQGYQWNQLPDFIQAFLHKKIQNLNNLTDNPFLLALPVVIEHLQLLHYPKEELSKSLSERTRKAIVANYKFGHRHTLTPLHAKQEILDYINDPWLLHLMTKEASIDRYSKEEITKNLELIFRELKDDEKEKLEIILQRFHRREISKYDLSESFQKDLFHLIEVIVPKFTMEEFDTLTLLISRLAAMEYSWNEIPSIIEAKTLELLSETSPGHLLDLCDGIALLSFDQQREDRSKLFHGPFLTMNQLLLKYVWIQVDSNLIYSRNKGALYLAWLNTFPYKTRLELLKQCPGKVNLPKIYGFYSEKVWKRKFITGLKIEIMAIEGIDAYTCLTKTHWYHMFPMDLGISTRDNPDAAFLHIVKRKTIGREGTTKTEIDGRSRLRELIYKHHYPKAVIIRIDKKAIESGTTKLGKEIETLVINQLGAKR